MSNRLSVIFDRTPVVILLFFGVEYFQLYVIGRCSSGACIQLLYWLRPFTLPPTPRFQYALRPLPAMNRSMPSVPLPLGQSWRLQVLLRSVLIALVSTS